jgi:hypothetical protein
MSMLLLFISASCFAISTASEESPPISDELTQVIDMDLEVVKADLSFNQELVIPEIGKEDCQICKPAKSFNKADKVANITIKTFEPEHWKSPRDTLRRYR